MAKKFEKTLVTATDSSVYEPDWDSILDCVDQVRGGEIRAKEAIPLVFKRLNTENTFVQLHSLIVLEAMVKNCGKKVHAELATRENMEVIKTLACDSKSDTIREKVLELLQCWAMAFANKPEYKMIVDTHNLMKLAGFDFPTLKEAEAMFASQVAPEWEDDVKCFRCRAYFGLIKRKHHCRACGQVFCSDCSKREMLLPQFGIEKPVRVCEGCYDKGVGLPPSSTVKPVPDLEVQANALNLDDKAHQEQLRAEKEKEEEEFQLNLAMAISQSEAEAKEKERAAAGYSTDYQSGGSTAQKNIGEVGGYKGAAEQSSEDSFSANDNVFRYIRKDYWSRNSGSAEKVDNWELTPSAPFPSEYSIRDGYTPTIRGSPAPSISVAKDSTSAANPDVKISEELAQKGIEIKKFCDETTEQIEAMENRVRSNVARGRPVLQDAAIQGLYIKLTEIHSVMLQRMTDLEQWRAKYEHLQDLLFMSREARAAITELQEEEQKKREDAAAEEQRVRQAQMHQKLISMRQQKHDMLLYQRQLAIQRLQQNDADRAAQMQQIYQNANPSGFNYPGHVAYQQQYSPAVQHMPMGYASPAVQQIQPYNAAAQQFSGYAPHAQMLPNAMQPVQVQQFMSPQSMPSQVSLQPQVNLQPQAMPSSHSYGQAPPISHVQPVQNFTPHFVPSNPQTPYYPPQMPTYHDQTQQQQQQQQQHPGQFAPGPDAEPAKDVAPKEGVLITFD